MDPMTVEAWTTYTTIAVMWALCGVSVAALPWTDRDLNKSVLAFATLFALGPRLAGEAERRVKGAVVALWEPRRRPALVVARTHTPRGR